MYWRFCLASWRQQYGDDRMQTLWLKFFHRWLRHGCAWVVTSLWYHSERVSGTARVAQFILHSNFYDMYSSSEMVYYRCCWPYCNLLGSIRVVDQPGHYHTQDFSKRCSECRWETWTKWNPLWEKGMRFSDTLLRKKWRQSESNRPLSDLSTDLLVVSRNQLGKKATCPFILFIKNSSHMC